MATQLVKNNFPNYGTLGDNFKIYNQVITCDTPLGINIPTAGAFNTPAVWPSMKATITDDISSKYEIPLDDSYNQSITASIFVNVPSGTSGLTYNMCWALRLFDAGGVATNPPLDETNTLFMLDQDGVMMRYSITLPKGHGFVRAEPIYGVRNTALTFVNWGWNATAQTTTGRTGSNPLIYQVISWR